MIERRQGMVRSACAARKPEARRWNSVRQSGRGVREQSSLVCSNARIQSTLRKSSEDGRRYAFGALVSWAQSRLDRRAAQYPRSRTAAKKNTQAASDPRLPLRSRNLILMPSMVCQVTAGKSTVHPETG
jgi:hypothetical protein